MFGYLDSQWVDLPDIFDESYLEGLRNQSGVDFPTILQEIDDRVGAFNQTADSLVAELSSVTREPTIEYADSLAFKFRPKGEYGMARPQRGELFGGYMLPLRTKSAAIGWTEEGLRKQNLPSILRNIDGLLKGARRQIRYDVIFRLYTNAEIPVEYSRTTATSPGFAGSGTGLNAYTVPYPNGVALPGGYTHYFRSDAAGRAAAIANARAILLKQGHEPPYDIIASAAQVTALSADTTNFVGVGSALIRPAPDQAAALVDPQKYIGVYQNEIRLRYAIDDFTSDNIAVVKLYGPGDERNPLRIRLPDDEGLPNGGAALYVRSRDFYPLAEAEAITGWGVGIGNRTGTVLIHIDSSGSYDPPTITDPSV